MGGGGGGGGGDKSDPEWCWWPWGDTSDQEWCWCGGCGSKSFIFKLVQSAQKVCCTPLVDSMVCHLSRQWSSTVPRPTSGLLSLT